MIKLEDVSEVNVVPYPTKYVSKETGKVELEYVYTVLLKNGEYRKVTPEDANRLVSEIMNNHQRKEWIEEDGRIKICD